MTALDRPVRRATVVFRMNGRLGNQLFQYSALRSILERDDRLLLIDFDDLARTFRDVDAEFRTSSRLRDRNRLRLLDRSARLRRSPPGRVVQDPESHLPVWVQRGLYSAARGYFQRDHPGHAVHVGALRLDPTAAASADAFLWDSLPGSPTRPLAFVHVRRGDYLTHAVGHRLDRNGREILSWVDVDKGTSVALPAAWYRARMDELRDLIPGVQFVLVGDDPSWSAEELAGPDTLLSKSAPGVDLAILSRCDAGILSASSFAWWGAWFAHRASEGPFLAPLHWLGYAVNEWWPEHIRSEFLTYRPVTP